jgi:hypothetical protein
MADLAQEPRIFLVATIELNARIAIEADRRGFPGFVFARHFFGQRTSRQRVASRRHEFARREKTQSAHAAIGLRSSYRMCWRDAIVVAAISVGPGSVGLED